MRRFRFLQLGLVLFFLFVVLVLNQPAFADPSLPLPRMPLCGDQSEPPVTLNCPDFSPLTDVQLYKVPGTNEVYLTFDFVYREASYNNELGFFYVDNQSGIIGDLLPGDPEYFEAALSNSTIVFPSGSNAYTPDVTLPLDGGKLMVFFIVQNNTVENFLSNNPTNSSGGNPLAFFSMEVLNPDSNFDHFVGFQHLSENYSQFGFEDQTGGGDGDYDDVSYTISPPPEPTLIDSDKDGLPDKWETDGVDTDLDGEIDLDLNGMGADKDVKDVFVWIDWLEGDDHNSHRPSDEAINLVKDAFDKQGIQLHIKYGSPIPEDSSLLEIYDFIFDSNTGNLTVDISDMKTLREKYFLENGSYPGRASVYHYSLFVHNIGKVPTLCPYPRLITPAGWANGSDFIVGLNRALERNELTSFMEALVFMHELGHTLGLGHGGVKLENDIWTRDDTNNKPNHLSIMNYAFGTGSGQGLTIDGKSGILDYSIFGPEDIPNINENDLVEGVGLNSTNPEVSRYGTKWFCSLYDKNGKFVEHANDPVDWNCDGDEEDEHIRENVNKDTNGVLQLCSNKYDNNLTASSDWQHLNYKNGTIGTIPTILPEFPEEIILDNPEPELPIEDLLEPFLTYLPLLHR